MLDQKVKTTTGKRIVQTHRFTGDAHDVFRLLYLEANNSTAATLSNQDMFSKLTTTRYDGRTKSAVEFVTSFDQMFDQYNEQQIEPTMRLNDMMMKTFMQTAVSDINMLLDVSNQEKQAVARGAPVFNYFQYLQLLQSTAALYDRRRLSRRTATKVEINNAEQNASMNDEIVGYYVHRMNAQASGTRIGQDTWKTLEPNTKKYWIGLPDHEKEKLLMMSTEKFVKSTKPVVHAHVTDIACTQDNDADEEAATDAPPAQTEINKTVTQARNDAHPGDARRMMGKKNQTISVNEIRSLRRRR